MMRLPKEERNGPKNVNQVKSKHIEELNQKYGNSLWIARVARKEVEKETNDLLTRVHYLKKVERETNDKIKQTEKLAEELQNNMIRNHEKKIKKKEMREELENNRREKLEEMKRGRDLEREKKEKLRDNLLKLRKDDAKGVKAMSEINEKLVKGELGKELETKKHKFNKVKSQENISQEKIHSYWVNRQKLFADHLIERIDVNDSQIQDNKKLLADLEKEEVFNLEKLQRSLQHHSSISQKLSSILLSQSQEASTQRDLPTSETPRIHNQGRTNHLGVSQLVTGETK